MAALSTSSSELKGSEAPRKSGRETRRGFFYGWGPEILLLLAAVGVVLPFGPSVMRESDQASVVRGAYELANGASAIAPNFYHYDKMYGSYFALAAADKVLRWADPVTAANLFQLGLWLLATVALIAVARRRSFASRALLVAAMLSPIWILNAPFFSPAAISAYVLVLAYCFKPRRIWGVLAAAALVFIATTFRADAILFVPFLIWSRAPRCGWKRWLLRPYAIACVLAAGAALMLGPMVTRGTSEDGTPIKILPKVIAAFTVFGLGPAALIFAMVVIALATAVLRKRWKLYYLAGLVSVLLPISYYIVQLLSPRYLMLTVTTLVCAVTHRRILSLARGAIFSRPFAYGLAAVTIIPFIVGFSLPSIRHPRLVFAHPTTYPTADGHYPMGALVGFAWGSRTPNGIRIDHNEEIYASVLSAQFEPLCNGAVPVIKSPMASYFELALRLRGIPGRLIPAFPATDCMFAYVDMRAMTHKWVHPFEPDGSPSQLPPLETVAGSSSEQPVVLVGREEDPALRNQLSELIRLFNGREFQMAGNERGSIAVEPGMGYGLISRAPFTAATKCRRGESGLTVSNSAAGLFEAQFRTNEAGCRIQVSDPSVAVARGVLPDYMVAGDERR